jgi:trehalose 6-phosphate phosphatase
VPVPPFQPGWALFLDVDGTLLDIAARPDQVDTHKVDCALVEGLQRAAGGALALISGRSLAQLDVMFAPLTLPAAGQHGFERRDVQGKRHRHRFPADRLQPAARQIREFASRHAGLVFEDKGASVALHYRLAPQLADAAREAVVKAACLLGGMVEVQGGKMVWELKPAGADKGMAIEEFMREAPYAGRTPVFLGDDITDEYGFRVVNRLEGHSIKIGAGETGARWRLADPSAARAWLRQWLETCDSAST